VPPGTVEDLPRSAREAGFEVAGMNGCFQTGDPEVFELSSPFYLDVALRKPTVA